MDGVAVPVTLTTGAIADISNNAGENLRPIVQVADLRPVQTAQSSAERYRLLLSDGVHSQQAMLATQMNTKVREGSLQKGSIIQLHEFICNTIQNRRIVIVIQLEVLVPTFGIIGDPKNYDGSFVAATASGDGTQSRASIPSSGAQAFAPKRNLPNYTNSINSISGQHVDGGKHVHPIIEHTRVNDGGKSMLPPGASTPLYGGGQSAANSTYPRVNAETRMQNGNNQNFPNSGVSGGLLPSTTSYGRSIPSYQHQQPQPPMYQNRGPIAKNEAPARIIPIAALNPYQGRWTIKARVTAKGDLRRYNGPRGEGKVFSFDLLDSDGGEIRVTCFNNEADQFYDQVDTGKVYLISRGSLKPAQKKFNHLKNDYEMFFESASMLQPYPDDGSIAKVQFNFQPISEIEVAESNSMVDVIGVVSAINPAVTILTKNGSEALKRTLTLKDTSGRCVDVTFWGNFCNAEGQQLQNMCDSGVFPVLAIKSGRVNDFNGKSISTLSTSQLFIDPDFPEAHGLKEWYNSEGKNVSAVSISRDLPSAGRSDIRKTISQIKNDDLGRSEKPDWITIKAMISFIKSDNFCYTACPLLVGDRPCNKKVTNNGDGNWHCDRCDQSFPQCDYRYLLQLQIQDHTGLTWVTAFQESGEDIMAISAKDLYLLKYEEQNDAKFADVIRQVLFNQYLFKLKVKEETFSDEQRVKSTVVKAEKVNSSLESKYVLGLIDKLMVEDGGPTFGRTGGTMLESGVSNFRYGNSESRYVNTGSMRNMGGSYQMEAAPHLAGQYTHPYRGGVAGYGNDSFDNRRIQQVSCNQCGSAGHGPHNCPKLLAGRSQATGGSYSSHTSYGVAGSASTSNCYKCQQPGHWARDCPGVNVVSSAYGNTNRYGY